MYNRKDYYKCYDYFSELVKALKDDYVVVNSCNEDITKYLIPKGTEALVTYKSKPILSFRISDHWNWYANTLKCKDSWYIQCFSKDMPWAKKRLKPGYASKPIMGMSVMLFDTDGTYHCVYGEVFDRKTKTWYWRETPIDKVLNMVKS